MNDVKTRQQIVEKVKSSTNILVTVSNDPSVDALSAALGLTVMLNKMGKHATAVFSGTIPPAITFLDPEKTFEATIDSLRDFIIALDKEKADHLRYKVEGDVVKIFITPYRTTITSDDLDFSQGDYNVELVLALGVDNQEHLDGALEAHGRILHDASVVTISAGAEASKLGNLDWHDEQASSLCEMLVGLGDSLKSDKTLLDQQIATALLTGVVASTDRFSNTRTSSKAMTVAAQLMAAGADQQLIAAKLQESHTIGELASVESADGTALSEDISSKIDRTPEKPAATSSDGGLAIAHDKGETLDDIAKEVKTQNQEDATDVAEQVLASRLEAAPAAAPSVSAAELEEAADPKPMTGAVDWSPNANEPSLGGTLNATTEQAEEDARRQMADDQNRTMLTHSYLGESPTYDAPINGATQPNEDASIDVFAASPNTPPSEAASEQSPGGEMVVEPIGSSPPPSGQTLADLDAQNRDGASRDDALASVHATFDGGQPSVSSDQSVVLPQPPPLPDFSTMPPPPPLAPAYAPDQAEPERLGDIFAPESQTPPPQDPQQPPDSSGDPGQFKIPGQQ